MSEANVAHLREVYEAFNRNDFDFVVERLSSDCEMHLHHPPAAGMASVYHGREGFRQFLEDWIRVWESLHSEVERIVAVDEERVLGLITMRGTARGGLEVENEYAHLVTIREGLETRLDGYPTWEEGIRAAGLDPAELKS